MVSASPKLNAATSANPRLNCFTCMQMSSTVKAAGHGSSPPVSPKRTICGVVTVRFGEALLDVERMRRLVRILEARAAPGDRRGRVSVLVSMFVPVLVARGTPTA